MAEGIPVLSVASINGVSAEELRLAIQETVQKQQAVVNAQAKAWGQTCLGAYNYRAVKVSGLAAGMLGKILRDETLKELSKQGGVVLRQDWNAATKSFRLLSRKKDQELFLAFLPDAGAYAVISCRTK